jgi:hypothetical protein
MPRSRLIFRLWILVLALGLLSPSIALAVAGPRNAYEYKGTVIDGLDLSTTRSFTVSVPSPAVMGIYGLMVVYVCVNDASNSVSDLRSTCSGYHTAGGQPYPLQACKTYVDGVCELVDGKWFKDPGSGLTCYPFRVDIEGFPNVGCDFVPTGADGDESLTVDIGMAVKGGR